MEDNSVSRRGFWVGFIVLVVIYLAVNITVLRHTVGDAQLLTKMQEKDSAQYVEIARGFAAGDFSMSYVAFRPHRQPLYPLLMAGAIKLGGDNPIAMGSTNIVVGLVMLACLCCGVASLFGSRLVGLIAGLGMVTNAFLVDKISARLLTEALHALLLTVVILYFIRYLQHGKRRDLFFAAVAVGLDYLTRPNGLFIFGAMLVPLAGWDLWKIASLKEVDLRGKCARLLKVSAGYAGAVLIFAIVATPSWLPRWKYFGNPIHHGNIANYMWVDSYDVAHVNLTVVSYGWKDYAASHDTSGFVKRWAHGFYHTYYDIPKHVEHVRLLYFTAVFGLLVACWERRSTWCLLAVFLFLQLLPVVWTTLANPGPRIPYGSLLPFELFFAACGVNWLLPKAKSAVDHLRTRMKGAGPAAVT